MKDFFLDKFEYDFYATNNWIDCILAQEDLVSPFVVRSIFSYHKRSPHLELSVNEQGF